MSDSIEQLAQRVRDKDLDALGGFIEQVRPQLRAYVERQLGTALRRKVEPDDMLQEVSADAVRSLPEIELGDRDPFSWLCQLAQRRIVDAHRHYFVAQKRSAGREVPLQAGGGDSSQGGLIQLLVASVTTPSMAFSRDAREMRLLEALSTLPEDQQTALRLRYVENLPSKEIAVRLNRTDGAVRVMLTRSLKRLGELLGPEAAPRP